MEGFSSHRPCSTRSMPFSGTSVSQCGTAHCMWRGGGVGKEILSPRAPARRVTTRENPEGSRGSCTWILRPSSSQTHSARPHLTKPLLGGLPQSSRGSQGQIGGQHGQGPQRAATKTAQAPSRKKSREATGSRTEPSSASTTTKTRFGLPLSCARLSRRLSLA